MHSRSIVIVTPALADANNGNWQTARRWSRLLGQAYPVRVTSAWDGGDEALMIALHARRSAVAIAAWKRARPAAPLVVVLGVGMNRFDATLAAQFAPEGASYAASALEWASTLGIIAAAMLIWYLAVRFVMGFAVKFGYERH